VALNALAAATGDRRFSELASSGATLVNELTRPLPPNWAIVQKSSGVATPVSGPDSTSGPGQFSFDAPRTLVWFGVSPSPTDRAAVARAWSVFSATTPIDIVVDHALSGTTESTIHNPVTLVGAAAAASAAGDGAAVPGLLDAASTLNAQYPTYYGGAWLALGRLLLQTRLLSPPAS
jgi:hypothetical protein